MVQLVSEPAESNQPGRWVAVLAMEGGQVRYFDPAVPEAVQVAPEEAFLPRLALAAGGLDVFGPRFVVAVAQPPDAGIGSLDENTAIGYVAVPAGEVPIVVTRARGVYPERDMLPKLVSATVQKVIANFENVVEGGTITENAAKKKKESYDMANELVGALNATPQVMDDEGVQKSLKELSGKLEEMSRHSNPKVAAWAKESLAGLEKLMAEKGTTQAMLARAEQMPVREAVVMLVRAVNEAYDRGGHANNPDLKAASAALTSRVEEAKSLSAAEKSYLKNMLGNIKPAMLRNALTKLF